MAININPNRINVATGRPDFGRSANTEGQRIPTPVRATENNIPSPESLDTLIRSAVSALRTGTFWDRGTILNLLA